MLKFFDIFRHNIFRQVARQNVRLVEMSLDIFRHRHIAKKNDNIKSTHVRNFGSQNLKTYIC